MLSRIDLRDSATDPRKVLPRAQLDVSEAVESIRPVVEAVRHHGTPAVIEATQRFDGVTLTKLRVSPSGATLEPEVKAALLEAIKRVRKVHEDQRRHDVTTQVVPGGTVTERWIPVNRVGLYVPGGLAMYPSTVIMNVVPAQIAGVKELVVCSPPQKETGLPDERVLAVCALLGVTEVYAVGGAQAIAMMAYGTDECAPVDMITGPGNVWVTAAKRLVRGVVGIDAEAGPTEIAILADDTADPRHVAADLISQAEHDPLAASVLITDSEDLADQVDKAIAAQEVKHAERIHAALNGPQSGVVLVSNMEQGLEVANAYAAEHLEIQTRDARALAMRVTNAGAIFVGAYSPVSLGDYCAGSNHVLPTGGCARHSSGLSVQTFLRGVHIVDYTEEALREVAPHVVTLSTVEDLPAHGQAVSVRFS
ncbi:histidinol dehydrogenase [Catelliglobosispora koreensis]|uniref:histidinol dehydrogenase n=1 Tax=Catelliglobosispora koreensis TaxID=129052 RepID=UPI000378E85B|nr:histidinol dehydrogenase [Catelliglobosispora koreensis]